MENDIVVEERVILFTDVHNFSLAFPEMTADLYGFLQAMLETLGEAIVGHQGEIIKYLGDAILCVFPAGAEQDAVACAMAMRQAFAGLVSSWGLPPDTELEVGISSGEVAIGTFGHRSLRQRDVFGEDVNRAAKIGHHRGIAITEPVYERVRASHETRRLPDFEVKWQSEPLRVWEVVE